MWDGISKPPIPVTKLGFAAFRCLRRGGLRVYLGDIASGLRIAIRIEINDVYRGSHLPDCKRDARGSVIVLERKIFVDKQGQSTLIADADIAARDANDLSRPTSFITWRFQLAQDAGRCPI